MSVSITHVPGDEVEELYSDLKALIEKALRVTVMTTDIRLSTALRERLMIIRLRLFEAELLANGLPKEDI
jgi:hypothetical protein